MAITMWNQLPEPAILKVFTHLSLSDRLAASQVCQEWSHATYAPELWRTFHCCFKSGSDTKYLKFISEYGEFMECLTLEVDEFEPTNRETCVSALSLLTNLDRRSLRKLRVKFIGKRPYSYTGTEIAKGLENLLSDVPLDKDIRSHTLEVVDFGYLPVSFAGPIIGCLAENHKNLRKLNIQNGRLENIRKPMSILNLVRNCCNISDLHVNENSLSNDVLIELSKEDRTPLEHLSIISCDEIICLLDIRADVWLRLASCSPDLKVTMKFHHTSPIENVIDILVFEIPLTELWLETFAMFYDEVVQKFWLFRERLEDIVLFRHLPITLPNKTFEETLISLTDQMSKLRSLHVFAVITEDTKKHILERHPNLVERGSFTLRCQHRYQQFPSRDLEDSLCHFF